MRDLCQASSAPPRATPHCIDDGSLRFQASFNPSHQVDIASELNNHAILAMQSQRIHEAIETLHEALRILCDNQLLMFQESVMHACLSLDSVKPTTIHSLVEASLAQSLLLQLQHPTIQSTPIDSESPVSVADNKDLTMSPQNYFSVYNRAFRFVEGRLLPHEWFRRVRLLPSVVLYNLGLAHQLLALQSVSCDEYQSSFYFYELALQAADEARQKEPCPSDYNLLVLAITNNSGFIASHMFNEQKTLYFAGRMLTTFATMDCSRLLSKAGTTRLLRLQCRRLAAAYILTHGFISFS
jgi:hypothetical protein